MQVHKIIEGLRQHTMRLIESGDLTQTDLARKAGVRQAHISNFLRKRRGLSVSSVDALLKALGLSAVELLGGTPAKADAGVVSIPVTTRRNAETPNLPVSPSSDVIKLKNSLLGNPRPKMVGSRKGWDRFVAIKVEKDSSMAPKIAAHSVVIIDRHYNALSPYRRGEQNVYLVRHDKGCVLCYVEVHGREMYCRTENSAKPIQIIKSPTGRGFEKYIIGRACHNFGEL